MSTKPHVDPLHGIAAHLHSEIKQVWATEVAGGRARYERTGSRTGVVGQWRVSRLLRLEGILPKTDGRWEQVRDHGRDLYYGRVAE